MYHLDGSEIMATVFLRETNLKAIQDVAISFLHLPLKETELGPLFVQHPFFNSAFVDERVDGKIQIVNILRDQEAYQRKLSEMSDRIRNSDLLYIWYMILDKYHLTFLKYTKQHLSQKDFSVLLADAWVSSEDPNQDVNVPIKTAAMWFRQADKRYLMGKDEFDVWQKLPDSFQIYRGVAVGRNPKGLSWTQSFETAKWFAHRFDTDSQKGYIQIATIERKQALAYFNSRGEDELVVDSSKLTIQKLSVDYASSKK